MLLVIDAVLGKEEVLRIRERIDAAQWQDGAATAGALARSQKSNQQLDDNDPVAIAIGDDIVRRVGSHPQFVSAALPKKIYPPKFNRYTGGGTYGAHVDSALMFTARGRATVRSDLAATLFLSEPEDYDGGELQIESEFGLQSVKLPAGDLILYPASSLHRVNPVTRGARIGSFFWVESFVADATERTLLYDLDQSIQGLTPKVEAGEQDMLQLTGIYHNLLRRWATT